MKFQFFSSLAETPASTAATGTASGNLSPASWYVVLTLATGSTLLCEFIAASAGWASGGSMRERLLMTAMGVVIVSSSHVLPALARRFRGMFRAAILTAWAGCLLYALLGQATFFAFTQEDAGDARAMAVPVPVTLAHGDVSLGRSLTVIVRDEAAVIAKQARTKAARCFDGECRWRDARERELSAQLASLKIEADEAKRHEAQEDRAQRQADEARALRESRRADPIASQLASLFGWSPVSVGMLKTYLPTLMAELLPGLLWTLVLTGKRRVVPSAAATSGEPPDKVAPVVEAETLKLDDMHADSGTAAKARRVTTFYEDLEEMRGAATRLWESGKSVASHMGRQYVARLSGANK